MTIAFWGFTFLLVAFFPIGGEIVLTLFRGFLGAMLKESPPILPNLVALVLTYLPAAVVTAWFFRASNLPERVPSPIPGRGAFLVGIVLTCLHVVARLLASTVEGGGGSFVVMQFAPFILWPAQVLLAIGAVKLLLAATPAGKSFQQTRASGR
ncbi:hypothetical protein [Curvibacter sp. PAE-UM]|uniref:hypothetical protein n=1 Tax=Curvibacter sp. PAE-UM TaxID=1714344 RepID=UPI0012E3E535|nr:hypothetical protein [Curvibacter sp. PAE-UM]